MFCFSELAFSPTDVGIWETHSGKWNQLPLPLLMHVVLHKVMTYCI